MQNNKLITQEALLRRPCQPCKTVAEGLRVGRELLDFIRRYNRERPTTSAAGLAAIQLGILKKVCVITTDVKKPLVLVNPRIVAASSTLIPWEESCISLPRKRAWTMRHAWVDVEADNLAETHKFGAFFPGFGNDGLDRRKLLEAVCVQHEIAHCESLLMMDFQETKNFFTVLTEKAKACLTTSSGSLGVSVA